MYRLRGSSQLKDSEFKSELVYMMSAYNPRRATPENMEEFFYTAYEGREYLEKQMSKRHWR